MEEFKDFSRLLRISANAIIKLVSDNIPRHVKAVLVIDPNVTAYHTSYVDLFTIVHF